MIQKHDPFHGDGADKLPSNRSFGLVFVAVFLVVGLLPLLGHRPVRWWALAVSPGILVISFALPGVLTPLNRVWMKFGLLLHKIVSPIILGIVFFLTVWPTGFLMRLCGKDPMRRKFDPSAKSYWILREPPGPEPKSMTNQF